MHYTTQAPDRTSSDERSASAAGLLLGLARPLAVVDRAEAQIPTQVDSACIIG
jgi:hypothetical protein